jgi:hypothetical protein
VAVIFENEEGVPSTAKFADTATVTFKIGFHTLHREKPNAKDIIKPI